MISIHDVDESPIKEKWRNTQGIQFQTTDQLADPHMAPMPDSGEPDRSKMISPAPVNNGTTVEGQSGSAVQHPSYHDIICSHLYHNGYLQGLYADLIIRLQNVHPAVNGVSGGSPLDGILFKLHRIIAIRSPYLSSLLQDMEANGEYQPIVSLTLPTHDPNLTADGLSIAFGHLYASYPHSLLASTDGAPGQRSALLRSVLCAANLLQLGDLANIAADQIKADITRGTVMDYCHFISQPEYGGSYGNFAQEIREAVLNYLYKGVVRDVAEQFGPIWGNREGEAYRELVRTFAELPFEWLKKVVESKSFEVPGDMERFAFAKEIISLRQRNKAPSSTLLAGEENVLLAFGSKERTGVTIVRKAVRGGVNAPHHVNGVAGGVQGSRGVAFGGTERRVWKAGH
ncbi:uncharacterized protein SPPG_06004 [Spizellomyces punctatus DAOM BR117]|uniref:BTB domain-containing protein n=1 Tax=Spizellomyces punctatus (strain DAOM BR117) TaxID=645134 RepID=A0A0L0HE68_SPIPD|nr:uncharacterized protein SPPG_06004 [Spizellomyces punctatus DAOM BR117]KNC99053.1 hypothetical protein SPPG_06004 [Spizellomyces punctatus DAOM BR117]|eukprot:XP_016607093.1 hypothetical protein SPPG_06004 [Spizellomyces punctatus DAOM BR117]